MNKGLGYHLSLDKISWKDISGLINSRNTTIQQNLCSTEFKSAVDTASIQLIPACDTSLWSEVLSLLMDNDTIYARIASITESTLFYGVVDRSNIDIETKKIPSSCSIQLNDVSTLYLDKEPKTFLAFREKKISEIVFGILDDIGMVHTEDNPMSDEDDITLPAYVIAPDDSEDYRAMIDTLLFEHGGYVLNTKITGEAEIVALKWKDDNSSKRVVASSVLVSTGIKTSTQILDEDGLDLTYYTLAKTEPDKKGKKQAVYVAVSSYSDTGSGIKSDTDLNAGYYYPEDGDLEATYQEYDDSLLDRAYNLKLNRKKNDNLAIVDVTETELSCNGYAYKDDGETIDYSKFYSGAELFDFPVLSSLGMTANPVYYPTKAWILGLNKTGKKINLQEFTIRGTVLYKNRKCRVLLPLSAENPEEYQAETIYTPEVADKFAQFYWHFKKNSRYLSSWKENGNKVNELGSLVTVSHKATEFGQSALVVSTELSFIRPDYMQTSFTAVAVGAWNEYPVKTWGMNGGKRGGISSMQNYYMRKAVAEEPGSDDTNWTATAESVTEKLPYLYKKEVVLYSNGNREEKIYLAAVFGATGKDGAFYQFEIESTNGVYFKSSSSVTILISRVYKNGAEEDSSGSTYNYTWKKVKANGVEDTSFTPELPSSEQLSALGISSGSSKAIVIRANSVDELATYYSVVEEK